jgi:RNA polymerase sigma-70 factor (ECF subfamily)
MSGLAILDRPLEAPIDIESKSEGTVEELNDVEGEMSDTVLTNPVGLAVVEQEEQRLLVARALEGEHEAFSHIVQQYGSLMIRTATMIVGDRDIAEDVVQDALILAWHHLPDLREASSLRPWLMRIVLNQCISFKRRLARKMAFVRQTISEEETNLAAMVADEHKGRMERDWDLEQAIQNLPVKQRIVVMLHYYNGMTLPEMSNELHISENTLKKRIQAALTNLRRVMRADDAEAVQMSGSTARAGMLAQRNYVLATV